ncbi:MAG TPA: hypothetical protein VEA19_04980 [Actinomycetota bacterium]|nr:hypothetical protein [Actinomycetota bacterium]
MGRAGGPRGGGAHGGGGRRGRDPRRGGGAGGRAGGARRSGPHERDDARRRSPKVHGALPTSVAEEIRATARGPGGQEALRLVEAAVADVERDRPDPAVRAATRAKELAPRAASIREILGIALYRTGRFRDAMRELQAYRRLSGRLDQNHLIADCQRALGAPEKAVTIAQETIAAPRLRDEVRAETAVVGGAALADLERFDEALTLLRRYRGTQGGARPHDLRVWYATADVLARAGRREEAIAEFRKILRHDAGAFDAAERVAALEGSR